MADLVGGAVLGLVFTEFWDAVKKAKDGVKGFKPELRKLEETLQMVDPMVADIKRINTKLKESDQREVERLTSIMEEGNKLVSKCLRVSRLNIFKKLGFQKQLVELDSKIIRFHNIHIQLGTFREVKCVRLELRSRFNELSYQIQSLKSCIKPDEVGRTGMSSTSLAAGATTCSPTSLAASAAGTTKCSSTSLAGSVAGAPVCSDTSLAGSAAGDSKGSGISLVSFTGGVTKDLYDFDFIRDRTKDLDLSSPAVPWRAPSTTLVPNVVPKAPSIGTLGLIFLILYPSEGFESVIIKITAIFIIICKAMKAIVSMLEKSESGLWMAIKEVGMLETTMEQLDDTMRSLDHVLEELMNKADQSEAAESLRRLLEEGEELISESSNMGWCNFIKKWQYQKKMVELDNKLLRFHSLYLLALLPKNEEKTSDESEMKDDEPFKPAHYDEDRHETKGRHMDTKEPESYGMLNNNVNPYQYLDYNPPISSSIGGFQPYALGH